MNILYLLYDGDCILCRNSAQALKIKNTIGQLEIINARSHHPLVLEAITSGYNLNEGILVKFNGKFYYGPDAFHFLALISSRSNFFNKLNSYLFSSKRVSIFIYPFFKLIRNILLFFQKIPPVSQISEKNLLQCIYGENSTKLPIILQKRYSNRPYSKDKVLLHGKLNISYSTFYRVLLRFFRLTGTLAPYQAQNIPVSVELSSNEQSEIIQMHRVFYYPNKPLYHFSSRLLHIKNNILIESIRFGFAVKLIYHFDDNKVFMDYGGYVFRLGKRLIPIPFGFLFGKFYCVEIAQSEEEFEMEVKFLHPIFGKIFQYDGRFRIDKSVNYPHL